MNDKLIWEAASVGCHWHAGPYTISTWRCGSKSGYRVIYKFEEVGNGDTLEEAQAAAETHRQGLTQEEG
jgi:hypothetical protein